jgi:L-seryl-tRNA(Ser) seleniumtransferase
MISSTVDEIMQRADVWRDRLGADAIVVEGESTVGGGSLPGETLPTRLVALPSAHVDQLALSLRQQSPPVIGRIESGSLHLDPRTVLPEQDEPLIQAVLAASVGAFN